MFGVFVFGVFVFVFMFMFVFVLLVVVNNNKKIDSISNRNEKLFEKNDSLKNKMSVINKKAEKYKKQNEENINYINSLSDNDIAKLFADEFDNK